MDPTVIPFVILLTLGQHQFISADNYSEELCNKLAVMMTINTTYKAKCIPNLKDVKQNSLPEGDTTPKKFPFDPETPKPPSGE